MESTGGELKHQGLTAGNLDPQCKWGLISLRPYYPSHYIGETNLRFTDFRVLFVFNL